jgi:hypothetical protein
MVIEIGFKPSFYQYEKTDFVQITQDCFFIVDGVKYWIPNGYWYDGASIPRIFWSLVGSPFQPKFLAPALWHDWGYLTHVLPRSVYDEGFRTLLMDCGVGSFKARIMWSAVRTGGVFAWGNTIADIEDLAKLKSQLNERPDGQKFLLAA